MTYVCKRCGNAFRISLPDNMTLPSGMDLDYCGKCSEYREKVAKKAIGKFQKATRTWSKCSQCKGAGTMGRNSLTCDRCGGTGKVSSSPSPYSFDNVYGEPNRYVDGLKKYLPNDFDKKIGF